MKNFIEIHKNFIDIDNKNIKNNLNKEFDVSKLKMYPKFNLHVLCGSCAPFLASSTFRKKNLCSRWTCLMNPTKQIPNKMHGKDRACVWK
jgi:hypothetical protein